MSNVVISRVCNLNCPYCFASEKLQSERQTPGEIFISLPDFNQKLAFLKRSGIKDLRLIGGEPTLHPQFSDLVRIGLQQGFHVLVFTHGLLSDDVCEFLEAFSNKEISLLINMNSQKKGNVDDESLHEQRQSVLKRLKHLASPGFNIFKPDFDLVPIFDAIIESGCNRVIRLGVANPILGGNNAYLHPKYYRFVGQQIASYAQLAEETGVHFEFDCGFVRCMFDDDELESLVAGGTHPQFVCSPILDLDLGKQVFYCFSLANHYIINLTPEMDAAEMRKAMAARSQFFRAAGVYPSCSSCEHKLRIECSGGCLAMTMRRFHKPVFDLAQQTIQSYD